MFIDLSQVEYYSASWYANHMRIHLKQYDIQAQLFASNEYRINLNMIQILEKGSNYTMYWITNWKSLSTTQQIYEFREYALSPRYHLGSLTT